MIVKCDENELVVTTATKDISLLQVQMAGKKKMMIEDFLRGNKLEKGVIFK